MENKREEIIRKAIIDKLGGGSGFNLYTADDILTVAEVTEEQIEEITNNITAKSKQRPKAKRTKGGHHHGT